MSELIGLEELRWAAGAALAAGGVGLTASVWVRPPRDGSEPLRLALRIRRLIWAFVLILLAAAAVTTAPVLLAAALVIGFEETLETGIVVHALRKDAEAVPRPQVSAPPA